MRIFQVFLNRMFWVNLIDDQTQVSMSIFLIPKKFMCLKKNYNLNTCITHYKPICLCLFNLLQKEYVPSCGLVIFTSVWAFAAQLKQTTGEPYPSYSSIVFPHIRWTLCLQWMQEWLPSYVNRHTAQLSSGIDCSTFGTSG